MDRDEDLFAPSLTQSERRELPPGQKPWRLSSQFYVAFFGGPLAVGAIAYLNGKRLGLPQARRAAIVGLGIAGFVAALVAGAVLLDSGGDRTPRLTLAVAGIAAFLAARELQKDADRLYGLNSNEDLAYDSLWVPGLVAVFLLGIFSLVVMASVT